MGHGLLIHRFLYHTQRRTTVGRTPLDELSARHRDLYLTTHNTHNRQTSMPPVVFETTISAGERPQTYAFKTWICGRLLDKIAGSNPAGRMEVCILRVLCVLSDRGFCVCLITRLEESYRVCVFWCVCVCVSECNFN